MIAAWMVYAVAIGALIALAAVAVESVLVAARQPVRFVWATAIVLTLGIAIVAPFRGNIDRASAPVMLSVTAATSDSTATNESAVLRIVHAAQSMSRAAVQTLSNTMQAGLLGVARVPSAVNASAVVLWLASAGVALIMLAAVYRRYTLARRAWPVIALQGVTVRLTPDVGPAVIGVAPAEIVVPEWVLTRSASEQQLVIAHEREHVRARDPLLLLLSTTAVALVPWHAALWFMWSRLRLAVELDCDGRVLAGGVRKPAYGSLLVELSGQRSLLSPVVPAFAFGTSHLEQRLVAMTQRPMRYRLVRRTAGVSLAAVALAAACTTELPTAAQIDKMDSKLVAEKMALAGQVEYVVDGHQVSKTEADAIAADQIASVAVTKGTGKKVSVINIKRAQDSVITVAGMALPHTNRGELKIIGDSMKIRDEKLALEATGVMLRSKGDSMKVESVAPGSRIRVRGQPSVPLNPANPADAPLVFIDGVVVANTAFNNLDPNTIASVEVIKGKAAAALSTDPRAANGIIKITLKH